MSEIQLRGVRVHNLQAIDLDLPYEKLIVFCGVSGSGKSSLAMDTLYAEGQRRYIESFSAYTRQFLEKLEKPEADHLDGIPPAAAVTVRSQNQMTRSTIGTSTETIYYLRLLFSKIGRLFCMNCGREVRYDSPESILKHLNQLIEKETSSEADQKHRIIIAFEPPREYFQLPLKEFQAFYQEAGFLRGSVCGNDFRFDEGGIPPELYQEIQTKLGFAQENETNAEPAPESENEKDSFFDRDFYDPEVDAEPDFSLLDEENEAEKKTSGPGKRSSTAETETLLDEESEEMDEMNISSFFVSSDGLADVGVTCENAAAAEALASMQTPKEESEPEKATPDILFFVDRAVLGSTDEKRIRDSIETALHFGEERCYIMFPDTPPHLAGTPAPPASPAPLLGFSRLLSCEDCRIDYPRIEPKLFSFNSPLGACPVCEGFGNLVTLDLDLIVPNKSRSLKDGAIAPWNTPLYKSRLKELLERAEELDIPVDVPFEKLTKEQRKIILYGSETHSYEGLSQFFDKLQKQKYKMHIRVFLSRWRSYQPCPQCHGSRLRPEAMAVRIGAEGDSISPNENAVTENAETRGKNLAELCSMPIREALQFFKNHAWTERENEIGRTALFQVENRLRYLDQVGLGYLTLERTIRTLSGGEQRRVCLTSALGSSLVNMLYVLDEPSIGLHPKDTDRLLESILALRDRGNTVVVVEHEETIIRAADQVVEIGPGAGQTGGQLVFQGSPADMESTKSSLTGSYLCGERTGGASSKRRKTEHGMIELFGASGHNLKNIDVEFPLGVLCLVTGVSGSGKSSLVQETLYPALCRKIGKENPPPTLPYTQILGTGQIDEVVMVDQSSIGRSPRSNPVTYLKIFDEIRGVFAETQDAKAKNFGAGHFSFNVDGGRCNTCKGEGYIAIDMQFMADMFVKCPQCHGKRYQKDVLEILYRGKNIADVLEMTAREAFAFFRGQTKVQQKLKRLMDVGLDYVRLGQPANTLSGGESQRLKLATYLSTMKKGRCLFLLDEPTTGLHFSDIVQLIDCFDALIDTGHSLIVVEHNLQMMRAADYLIDLGPGPAEQGGRVIAAGTPEEIAKNPDSLTGRFLAPHFQ